MKRLRHRRAREPSWRSGTRCSRAARATSRRGSRRCAARSSGATPSSPMTSAPCSVVFSVFTNARLADVGKTVRAGAIGRRPRRGRGIELAGRQEPRADDRRRRTGDRGSRCCRRSGSTGSNDSTPTPSSAASIRRAHAVHYTELALALHRRLTYADRAGVLECPRCRAGQPANRVGPLGGPATDHRRLDELLEPLWGYYDARGDYRGAIVLGEDFLRVLARCPTHPSGVTTSSPCRPTSLGRTSRSAASRLTPSARSATRSTGSKLSTATPRQRFSALAEPRFAPADALGVRADGRGGKRPHGHRRERRQTRRSCRRRTCSRASGAAGRTTSSIAIEHADKAVAHFEAAGSGFVAFRVGPNPGVVALAVSGLFRWMAGFAEGAVGREERAVRLAREARSPSVDRLRAPSRQHRGSLADGRSVRDEPGHGDARPG